ncbi:hypothetical protein [Mucilaginibacter segetis]|uniref:Uncharacterized protein n=1 Tax=Mucilaginibacter segetis TaxID=2793071 RepID=A0A934PPZ5_9SPHI|nr:hypothetical protein [Mucilaginibacter segetis]MBK0378619.1 hypothetical protein [Mucilaginibacter segetis]
MALCPGIEVMNSKRIIFGFFMAAAMLYGCKNSKKLYISDCNDNIAYKKVGFSNLLDSLKFYDKQYVEVSGKYTEGKHLSALVNDSLFTSHNNSHALWVNFSQDCPLQLAGKRTGLFEYDNGNYVKLNNRSMTIRGIVDIRQKGHLHAFSGAIDRVSYVELY